MSVTNHGHHTTRLLPRCPMPRGNAAPPGFVLTQDPTWLRPHTTVRSCALGQL